jgi:hypothetical protein
MIGICVCISICAIIWIVNGIWLIQAIRDHVASEIYMHIYIPSAFRPGAWVLR